MKNWKLEKIGEDSPVLCRKCWKTLQGKTEAIAHAKSHVSEVKR